jgi:pimeloyl-ACP methyl ester carboxylesterase
VRDELGAGRGTVISYPFGVDGRTTRVLESGSGSRHLLLLHGAGSRADRWRRNIDDLARRGCHVVAVDFPGHGFADKGEGVECSVPAYVRFVAAVIDALELERPILVGTSLGGHVAASYALDDPNRCAGVVLVGPTGLSAHGPERRARTARRLRDTTVAGIEEKLANLVHDRSIISAEWIEEERRINNSPGAAASLDTLARYFETALDDDCIGDRFGELIAEVPTLLVWGSDDAMVPVGIGRDAVDRHPGLRLVEIGQAGHAPYFERPHEFDNLLSDFVSSIDSRDNTERHSA